MRVERILIVLRGRCERARENIKGQNHCLFGGVSIAIAFHCWACGGSGRNSGPPIFWFEVLACSRVSMNRFVITPVMFEPWRKTIGVLSNIV